LYSNIYPTKCNVTQFIYIWKLLYMFRVILSPIIRNAYNCIYSIWYLSHRYCYLPLSWKIWNRFECAVGGVLHPQHTQTTQDRKYKLTKELAISEEILNQFTSSDLLSKVNVIRVLGISVTEFDKCRCVTQTYDITVLFLTSRFNLYPTNVENWASS
jgi:hypothetical protein